MTEALRLLLSLSLAGSCVAAVAVLCHRLCRDWAPRRFLFLLWLPVLLSFLLPLGSARSPLRALSGSESGAEEVWYLLEPSDLEKADFRAESEIEPLVIQDLNRETTLQIISPEEAVFAIWAVGAVLAFGWKTAGYLRFRRRVLANARPAGEEEQALLRRLTRDARAPRLLRSAAVPGPMLMGLFHSVLVLPEGSYAPEVLEDVLAHELCHWKRHDLAMKWLAALVCCVHWFNPLVWRLAVRVDRDCELACDERVLQGRDLAQRLRYGRTLILAAAGAGESPSGLTAPIFSQKQRLKERLDHIMKEKKSGRGMTAALCTVALIVALSTVVFGAYAGGETAPQPPVQTRSEPAPQPDLSAPEQEKLQVPVRVDEVKINTLNGRRVHPITGEKREHKGTDIVVPEGTAVYAAAAGTVAEVEFDTERGNYVVLDHGDLTTVYCQLKTALVSKGQKVDTDTQIGEAGKTGRATGPHLHFEVYRHSYQVDALDELGLTESVECGKLGYVETFAREKDDGVSRIETGDGQVIIEKN